MRWLLILALIGFAAGPVRAQTAPTFAEVAAAVCIGPGLVVADPLLALVGIPRGNCTKACRASVRGCLAVVSAVNQCGTAVIRSLGKIGKPICEGDGSPREDCKDIRGIVRANLSVWQNGSGDAALQCMVDSAECYDVCFVAPPAAG